MKNTLKNNFLITLILIILGQLIFFILSPRFLEVSYSNRIYGTVGVQENQENLQSLSEAAHQFGQTLMGWLKFPSFMEQLSQTVELPQGASISAYQQERQNIIITLMTPQPIEEETLVQVEVYIQNKIEAYNQVSQTEFILTQLDFEQVKLQKTYSFGAGVTLVISLILGAGIWFLRRELR